MIIVLSDGTVLRDLVQNGDEFEAPYSVSSQVFSHSLSRVDIYENTTEEPPVNVLSDAKLVYCRAVSENLTRFALVESSSLERSMYALRADIDYIAMLTGIQLEV